MSRLPRSMTVHPLEIEIVHCHNTFARQLYMLGHDQRTRERNQHRKRWVMDMERILGGLFGIDLLGESTMENHLHLVLRNRPDAVAKWSDEDVVIRWLQIAQLKSTGGESPKRPTAKRIAQELKRGPERIFRLRCRLSDISWFMAALCENISRRINREEGRKGTCWEGRFHSHVALDMETMITMICYVDLNEVRARIVQTIEESKWSSIGIRLGAISRRKAGREFPVDDFRSGSWLSAVELDSRQSVNASGNFRSATGRRATDKGFFDGPATKLFELEDWLARRLRPGKRGATPAGAPPLLDRLGISPEQILKIMAEYPEKAGAVVGNESSMARSAEARGQNWVRGISWCREVYGKPESE